MDLNRLGRVDVRLELTMVGLRARLTATITEPFDEEVASRLVLNVFNLDDITEASADIVAQINDLVERERFTPDSLDAPELSDAVKRLQSVLLGQRFVRAELTLGELLARVIGRGGRPVIAVNQRLGVLPWEVLRLPKAAERLGDIAHIVGDLTPDPDQDEDDPPVQGLLALDSARGKLTFEQSVELRAAGEASLKGARAEAQFVASPGGISTGQIAPTVTSVAGEPPFFSHFGPRGYEVVHFFAHCDYAPKPASFRLHVTQQYPLDHTHFVRNAAVFRPGVFHFLNVCAGAPTPATAGRSLVEYIDSQHLPGGILACMTKVRSTSAAAFAEAFYKAFLPPSLDRAGQPALEAVACAREHLRAHGSAAGYLYRLFGRADVRLEPVSHVVLEDVDQ